MSAAAPPSAVSRDGARVPDGDDVALAASLVREAGSLAARMRAQGVEGLGVERKTSVSDVVTAADRAAEELVVSRLAAERPDDGVLGEEGAASDGFSGRRWVIDPVDGTYNFLSGLTWWCSAIALVEDDELVLGAVYHPHDDELLVGGPALPTRCDDTRLPTMDDVPLELACVATYLHPRRLVGEEGRAFARAVGTAAAARMLGSGSMDATAVARGRLGLVLQHSVPLWDELPGAALIRGVGGSTAHVEAAGRTWYAAGAPTAVREAGEALRSG